MGRRLVSDSIGNLYLSMTSYNSDSFYYANTLLAGNLTYIIRIDTMLDIDTFITIEYNTPVSGPPSPPWLSIDNSGYLTLSGIQNDSIRVADSVFYQPGSRYVAKMSGTLQPLWLNSWGCLLYTSPSPRD